MDWFMELWKHNEIFAIFLICIVGVLLSITVEIVLTNITYMVRGYPKTEEEASQEG